MNLTEKQKQFCREYIIDFNGAAAARRCGYAVSRARITASQLLDNSDIQVYLKELMAEQQKRLEISADHVLSELMAVGFANATDFVNVQEKTVSVGRKRNKVRVVLVENTEAVPEVKRKAIAEIRQNKDGIAIKLHDKVRALQLLGMHLGIFEKDNLQRNPPVDFDKIPVKFR